LQEAFEPGETPSFADVLFDARGVAEGAAGGVAALLFGCKIEMRLDFTIQIAVALRKAGPEFAPTRAEHGGLLGRRKNARDCGDELVPLGFFGGQLLFAGRRQPIVLELAVAVLGGFPFRGQPAFLFQAMQRGIKRAVLDLKDFIRGALDVLGDFVAVSGPELERAEDQQVERSLQ